MNLARSSSLLLGGEAFVMLCRVAVLHLYARQFDDDGILADYVATTAGIQLASPFLGMGVYAAVLYYVGIKSDDLGVASSIVCTSLVLLGGAIAIFFAIIVLLIDPIAGLYYGKSGRSDLLLAASLLLSSRMLFSVVISFLWGQTRALAATILNVAVLGLIPLAVIVVAAPTDLSWLIAETAILSLVAVGIVLGIDARTEGFRQGARFDRSVAKDLLRYGLPRVPAVVGNYIFVLPVPLSAWLGSAPEEVLTIAYSLAVLRMLSVSGRAVTYLALPRIAKASKTNISLLTRYVPRLAWVAAGTGLLGMLGFLILGNHVIRIVSDRSSLPTQGVTVFLWLSVAPFVVSLVLRPVIDGLSPRAYATRNALLAVLTMAVSIFAALQAAPPASAICIGTAAAIASLASLNALTALGLLRTTRDNAANGESTETS
jgi:O-antigen/teichoic acid export membrane protein